MSDISVPELPASGTLVTLDELRRCKVPPPDGRWHPISHFEVLTTVKEMLAEAGYRLHAETLVLSRRGARFFGFLDLEDRLAEGVSLSLAVRNSTDKSFPLGCVAGSRALVSSTLTFRSELFVKRKHTTNGRKAFGQEVRDAVASLGSYKTSEERRIDRLAGTKLAPETASHLILKAFRQDVFSAPQIRSVCDAWEKPPYAEFRPRTAWSLVNVVAWVLKDKVVATPMEFVKAMISLSDLLDPERAG